MNFLVNKVELYGPNHGVLALTLEKAYQDPWSGEMSILHSLADLSEYASGDKWSKLFGDAPNPSVRRYLALSLDWDREGESTRNVWSDFAHEALTQNSINGQKLADDVDVILMVSKIDHPSIFQHLEPGTTALVDFSEMDFESGVEYFSKAIKDSHPAIPVNTATKLRRDDSPTPGM